ncbi:MAG: hypothetical protein HYR75_08970 [Gemmatimonadetes bacterium]|nr:hypothetical protein [Gemmatimonadota bacterium]
MARGLLAILALVLAPLTPREIVAQVDPSLSWRTLRTEHFRVHFSPGLDSVARRAAGSAERAWGRLAAELHEPRGPVDLVVADNVDYTNGNATVFPSNRITIFARPVVDASSLRFLDDWIDLAVSHELTHIFHLDRSRGWWRLGQYVFGRNPFLFPGLYTPSWLDEGVAVYFETKLTGAGRIAGTDHYSIVRAQVLDGVAPALTAISQATPRWPGGNQVYAYGSLLVDYEARRRAGGMRDFIERTAGRTIPFLLNTNARAAFGMGFDSALVAFTDSVRRAALAVGATTAHDLTATGWSTERLRWLDAGHLRYANDDARDVTALRDVDVTDGATRWVERRNSLDVTTTLRDGARLFTQLDFIDPYTLRGDLYLERGGETTRLTDGARLTQADVFQPAGARASAVVAVQLEPGTARLVRLNVEGGRAGPVERLTAASIDTLWSEPRWSHDGTRIAAARWRRGGTQDIVVLDAVTGRIVQSVGASRAVVVSPAWSAGDTAIFFTSDRSGRSALYRASLANGALSLVASSATALIESEPSPDGTRLATTQLRGDGAHVAIVPLGAGTRADSTSVLPAGHNDPVVVAGDSARAYRPWRTLLPTYWLPAYQQTDDAKPMYGFITSGTDVVGRHAWTLQTTYSPDHQEPSYDFSYAYAGLKNPLLGVASTEEWDHFALFDPKSAGSSNPVRVGTLARRKVITDLALTLQRPRLRSNSSLSVGAEFEYRDFRTDPSALIARMDPGYSRSYTYPAFFVSAGFSNVKFPALAISYEDGVQLAASARTRWRSDSASGTHSNSVVAVASAFKALDFAGFAHHVIAVRAAAGWENSNAPTDFNAGGTSGSQLSVIPGVVLGDGRRTFGVRGFAGDAQYGSQALGGSFEYRAPLGLPNGGLWNTPLFFRSLSAIAFADAATAWCPAGTAPSAACPLGPTPRDWLASAGAELDLDAALEYDVPYRFRLGVAQPVAGRKYTGATGPALFFALGLSF